MPIQSKAYTMEMLLAECVESNRLDNGGKRVPCDFIDWLRANQDASLEAYEAMLQANLEWGPEVVANVVATSHRHNDPTAAYEIQRLYVGMLVNYPFSRARVMIEKLLWAPPAGGWDREAHRILIDHLARHHRNPRRFLTQPGVAKHLPASVAVTLAALVDHDFDPVAHTEA